MAHGKTIFFLVRRIITGRKPTALRKPTNIIDPAVHYQKATWNYITLEYIYSNSRGEFDASLSQNVIGVALAPHNKVVWRVDNSPSQTGSLPVGTIYLCASEEFLWLYRDQASECLHMTLDPNLLNRVAADSGLAGNVAIDYRAMFTDPTILHVAHLFKSEIKNSGLAGSLYQESLTNLLAVHMLRNYCGLTLQRVVQDGLLDELKLKQVKDFIEDNLVENITIAQMAAIAHMSQFHFARVFKAAIGLPPHRYLTQQRIERAKLLLSITRLSVAEVAYQVGFDNKSHFTAQFRKATGTTPKVYRESF